MNIQDLDLNLLLVFNAIYHERSVSAAAEKLGLSQPAISAALRKLRDYTGDALFFRSGNRMTPTRMANTLAGPIGQALSIVQTSFNAARSFDPRTATRTFRIVINDFFRATLLPTLMTYTERDAPGIVLEFLPQARTAAELLRALREEEVDLGMLPLRSVEGDVSYTVVDNDELLFVVRRGHPVLDERVTKDIIRSLRWAKISSTPAIAAVVEKAFLDAGIVRRIGTVLPDTVSVPEIITGSNMITAMGRRVFERAREDHPLTTVDLPIKLPALQGALVWAKSADDDQGLLWLRRRIEHTMRTGTPADASA